MYSHWVPQDLVGRTQKPRNFRLGVSSAIKMFIHNGKPFIAEFLRGFRSDLGRLRFDDHITICRLSSCGWPQWIFRFRTAACEKDAAQDSDKSSERAVIGDRNGHFLNQQRTSS